MALLDVRDLRCTPLGEPPVKCVSLSVAPAELVAVCGPNGAGKSTLCRCIAGLRPREQGTISLAGAPLPVTPWRVARAGVIVLLKGRRVFPELTVVENLFVAPRAWADGSPRRRLDEVFDLFPALADHRQQRAGTLSGGEQQMVAIGRALLARPRMLVLDEPSLGLAPRVIVDVQQALLTIRSSGVGVLVFEEDSQRLAGLADRHHLMNRGRMTAQSAANSLDDIESRGPYEGADSGRDRDYTESGGGVTENGGQVMRRITGVHRVG